MPVGFSSSLQQSDQAHSMDSSGYNLRQRSLPVVVSSQSSIPTSVTMSSAHSLVTIAQSGAGLTPVPTMATSGQEKLGSDSVQGINTTAEPMASAAASLVEIPTVVNVVPTVSDVAFAANVFDINFARNA